ncbi:MAG TPA: FliH/SctL family protein [Candidatus Acidoferrales bacterium]|nr:FliH/SctL family protein [Candidatus Acidoferrales bacterium]
MSCKVLRAGDPRPVESVWWKHVAAAADGNTAATAPEDGRAQAERLHQQMSQRVQEARAQGFREGEAAGRAQGAAEVRPVIDRLARAIDEISNLRARFRREAEADTIQLALAIARRVLRRQMAVDPDALHGLVLGALEKLEGNESSRVRIHPSHAAAVSACFEQYGNAARIEILPDPSREPGTVIFETQRGNLDASIDSQLQEIERGLADCLRRQL